MEHAQPVKTKTSTVGGWKRRLGFSAAVSAAVAVTLCLFGPLDLFFNNYEQLWFHFQDIIGGVAIVASVIFLVATAIGTLLRGKLHSIYMALLFGGLLGLYVQGTFMNKNYGTLNGKSVDWSAYTGYGVMNAIVWAVCLAVPLILMLVLKEKKLRPVMIFLACALMAMQGTSLVVSYINYPTVTKTATLTTDGIYTLSKKSNTVVFVVDTMDETYFQELMKNHPEYKKKLQGFVSYDNAMAAGARTPVALPLILTGIPRTIKGTYAQYIDYAWKNETVFQDMKSAGYDTRVFTESHFVSQSAQNVVDNLKMTSSSVGNYPGLIKKLYKLTLYKYCPQFLKWRFWMYTGDFDKFTSDDEYIVDDARLYKNYQKNNGFTYTDDEKCFRLYHLMGAHEQFTLQADGTRSNGKTSLEEQTEGSFHILFDMLDDMKENGVYDKSNIIIIADHGDLGNAQYATCLYKPAGSTNAYSVSSAPVSFLDVPATIDSLAGGDVSKVGSGITITNNKVGEKRTRKMYLNIGNNATFITGEYESTGLASDTKAMKLVNQYEVLDSNTATPYTMGKMLSFTGEKATANVYCTHGFRSAATKTTRMEGHTAQMVIPIDNPPDSGNLQVTMWYRSVVTTSNMVVTVGGKKVFEQNMVKKEDEESISFTVPVSALKDGTLTLNFTFTDVPKSEEDKAAGTRIQTARVTRMQITAAE